MLQWCVVARLGPWSTHIPSDEFDPTCNNLKNHGCTCYTRAFVGVCFQSWYKTTSFIHIFIYNNLLSWWPKSSMTSVMCYAGYPKGDTKPWMWETSCCSITQQKSCDQKMNFEPCMCIAQHTHCDIKPTSFDHFFTPHNQLFRKRKLSFKLTMLC